MAAISLSTGGSAGYVNGAIDVHKWDNKEFHKAVAHPAPGAEYLQYTNTPRTYAEQRRFNMFALEALADEPASFLAKESDRQLREVMDVSIPDLSGLAPVDPASLGKTLRCGNVSLSLDRSGAIKTLTRHECGGQECFDLDFASEDDTLAQLQYQSLNESDFVWYHSSTANGCGQTTCPCRDCEHGFGKYNSSCPIEGLELNTTGTCANPVDKHSTPTLRSLHVAADECSAVARLEFDPQLPLRYGAPQAVYLRIELGAARVNLTLVLWNKTSTRLPEATYLNFRSPAVKGARWEMDKLGSWVDPEDVVTNGNQYQHGVHRGVRYGGLTVETLDAILTSPITDQPARSEVCAGTPASGDDPDKPGCHDIWCTWQGTPTALPGGGTLETGLNSLTDVRGIGYNLHNNLWSINYPVFSPYENELWAGRAHDDRNYQFRFALRLAESVGPD